MSEQSANWRELLLAVGELEAGFSENSLPESNKLINQSFQLFADGLTEAHSLQLHSATEFTWHPPHGAPQTNTGALFELRPNIFFLDWQNTNNPLESMSAVLDLETQEATWLHVLLPTQAEAQVNIYDRILKQNQMSAVKITLTHAGIGRPRQQQHHHRTTELIGKRLKHTYSPTHTFEHIYLNENFFAWQSLLGPDAGMADVEPVNYLKIAPNLYLFNWYERLVPWAGVLLMDLAQNRAVGKMHYQGDLETFAGLTYVRVGTHIQFLNETVY